MRQLIEILINQIPFVHDHRLFFAVIFFSPLLAILIYTEFRLK